MNFDIETIKRKMLVKYPFFGSVVANIEYKSNKTIQIAGTDGNVIQYNPEFLEKLSVSDQIFIFTHEVCHIAFNHILRSEGKNLSIWNIATDAVINALLKRDGLTLFKGAIDMEDAINYDAEELYEKLLKEQQQKWQRYHVNNVTVQNLGDNNAGVLSSDEDYEKKQNNQSYGNCVQTSGEQQPKVTPGTHSMWDEAILKHKDNATENNISEIEKKQEETMHLGEKNAFKKNLEEKKKELEELKKMLSQQTLGSSATNRDIRKITDIGRANPLIDWRYVLKETIDYDTDWSYRNATIENGVISAKLEEQPMVKTEILLDTSGSINEVLLKNFLRECKNILQYSILKVGCFDTKFYGFHEIKTESDIENMRFEGGGGTNFKVALNAFSRKVENKIIFTDGDAYMPDISLDAIWIVFGGIQINPKGGKVIQIDTEQLYSYQQDSLYKVRIK